MGLSTFRSLGGCYDDEIRIIEKVILIYQNQVIVNVRLAHDVATCYAGVL